MHSNVENFVCDSYLHFQSKLKARAGYGLMKVCHKKTDRTFGFMQSRRRKESSDEQMEKSEKPPIIICNTKASC